MSNKILAICGVLLLVALVACGKVSGNETDDIREIVWSQLTSEAKKEILGTWKEAMLEKVVLDNKYVYFTDDTYYGKELFHIVFETINDGLLGPIGTYVDPQTLEIVGYDLRD